MDGQISYSNFRKDFENFFSRYPGIIWKKPASVVNEAFPGTFNLSFNEVEHLEKFGSYINYSEPMLFGKVQPVIRHNDFTKKIIQGDYSYKYLGLFDMGGISLSFPDNKNIDTEVKKLLTYLWQYLFDFLKLSPEHLYVKVSKGGDISKITNGKYNFKKVIPPDNLAKQLWLSLGLKESHFIYDDTRDTFLALNSFGRVSPWGYRNEILYDIGKGKEEKDLLDIATLEYFLWKPIIDNDKIIDIEINQSSCIFIGFGLDRLHFLKERMSHILKCDHIQGLYILLNNNVDKVDNEVFILTEALRVVHRIFNDVSSYMQLSQSRKKKLSIYLQIIEKAYERRKWSIEDLRKVFTLDTETSPYRLEFKESLNLVINQVEEAIKRREVKR
jgi:hypothetical protein